MAVEDIAKGPVGAKMIEMLEVPSFARGLKPSMLFDLAKDKGLITKEQQADFTKRVGKDRTALGEFNKIVIDAGEPRLAYRGQTPIQIEMIRARNLMPATAANQPERIRTLKTTSTLVKEAAEMDATTEVKQKTFLDQMRKAFGDLSIATTFSFTTMPPSFMPLAFRLAVASIKPPPLAKTTSLPIFVS